MKILMVCLGNICRSPLADALLRKKVAALQLDVEVDSAGTANYHVGKSPDNRTQANAQKQGVEMNFLRARQFSKADFKDFDLIYAMDKSNRENILALAESEEDRKKVQLLLSLLDDNPYNEVPDPYYGGEEGFQLVFDLIDQATDRIIAHITSTTKD